MANTQPVTEEQIRTFDEDGVLLLKALINEQWQQTLCESIEQDIANPGPHHHAYEAEGGKGRFHGSMRVWEHNPGFRDYCWNSPLPALAAQFLKTDKINLFYDQLFVKEPSTSNRTRWHNDQPYWPVRGWPVMSFWVALDPVTKETGAVEFIPGSHRWGHWFQPENFAPGVSKSYEQNPDFVKMPDIETEREQHKIVSWDMEPGDVLASTRSSFMAPAATTATPCGDAVMPCATPDAKPSIAPIRDRIWGTATPPSRTVMFLTASSIRWSGKTASL
jgi:ectoine hydroxylase-related dioxygenase (phytanoyl-CoA dioxygenase family)